MGARKLSYSVPLMRDYKEITPKKLEIISKGNTANFSKNASKISLYYYPACPENLGFGMLLPNRHEAGNECRYGFNGMEKDDEIHNVEGSSYDFGARIYDSRVGRWLSRDPLEGKNPEYSPYKSLRNNPIVFVDPDGKDEIVRITIVDNRTGNIYTVQKYLKNGKVLTDGELHEGLVSYYQNYYNYVSDYTLYINKDGTLTTYFNGRTVLKDQFVGTKSVVSGVKLTKPFDDGKKTAKAKDLDGFELEGSGGTQPSGFALVKKGGGASPTKQKGKKDVKEIEVGALLALLGISGGNPANIYERATEIADGLEHVSEAIEEAKKTGGGVEEKKSGGNNTNGDSGNSSKKTKENNGKTIKDSVTIGIIFKHDTVYIKETRQGNQKKNDTIYSP